MSVPMYLQAGTYVDSDAENIIAYATEITKGIDSDLDRAVALYYRIRDEISYTFYVDYSDPDVYRASWTLDKGEGFCMPKAAILAACARVVGIPSRLGFADVRNHISTKRIIDFLGSDVMPWHAYTELFLERKWVKATPAFNLGLCEKLNIKPLEFDGRNDSIFHPYTEDGTKHMEYLCDHGIYADVPLDKIIARFMEINPEILKQGLLKGNFTKEIMGES